MFKNFSEPTELLDGGLASWCARSTDGSDSIDRANIKNKGGSSQSKDSAGTVLSTVSPYKISFYEALFNKPQKLEQFVL